MELKKVPEAFWVLQMWQYKSGNDFKYAPLNCTLQLVFSTYILNKEFTLLTFSKFLDSGGKWHFTTRQSRVQASSSSEFTCACLALYHPCMWWWQNPVCPSSVTRSPSETGLLQGKNYVKPRSSTKTVYFPGREVEKHIHGGSHRFQGLVSSCAAGPDRPIFLIPQSPYLGWSTWTGGWTSRRLQTASAEWQSLLACFS